MSGTPTPADRSRLAVAGAVAALASVLAGCADVGRALSFGGNDINVESPTAGAALAATRTRYVTPRFNEVPPKPTNPPSAGELRRRVQSQVAERDALDRWIAAHPQANDDTEGYVTNSRAVAAKGGAAPIQDHTAAAEAWAAKVRASATPPPPPQ